jgi:phosphotransferase system  glucose/maltose/N-acetylglucosamine-specific IIC component
MKGDLPIKTLVMVAVTALILAVFVQAVGQGLGTVLSQADISPVQ